MALGRQGERQGDLVVTWKEMPRSPGHVFYDRLQGVLIDAGCDVREDGGAVIPPGRYFRMHMVGYFEGIDSERGIEWRCADSLSLREFLRLGTTARVPLPTARTMPFVPMPSAVNRMIRARQTSF